jgi:hypothetical protein
MKPALILAHGLGGRADLPIPAWMFGYGAAITLLISFAALALLWPKPRLEGGSAERVLSGADSPILRALAGAARLVGLIGFLAVLVAAALGQDDPAENLSPVAVYVVFWVGMTFVSGLVGDVWRVLSPFDTIALIWERVGNRNRHMEQEDGEVQLPEDDSPNLGYWPAAAGLAVFAWVELVFPDRAKPSVLFFLIALYTLVMVSCAARWGRDWLRRGEAFAAFFGLISHVAPLYRDDDGRLRLRPPFAGLATLEHRRGLEAVVLVALGSTTYDGITRSQSWLDLTGDMSAGTTVVMGSVVLAWAVGLVSVIYVGAMRIAARLVGNRLTHEELGAAFVHSLVPIALAYAVAHYFSLLALEGQAAIALVSDPLGRGWDLFGSASRPIDYGIVTALTVAYVQAAAIVIGHVAGVVVAHDRALVLFERRLATRSQYPLLGAMVLFTVGGLLLLLGG